MFRWGFSRDPLWSEFNRLDRRMNELLYSLAGSKQPISGQMWSPGRIFPLLNVRKVENTYTITAEIPGMKTEDLEIKVEGDTVSLKGERKAEDPASGASYHRRERTAGTFQRSLTLPTRVDADRVKANYQNGVLTVTLPVEKSAEPKQITVSTE